MTPPDPSFAEPAVRTAGLLFIALGSILVGGALALLCFRWQRLSSACAVAGVLGGTIAGEVHAFGILLRGGESAAVMPWNIPYGQFHVAVDPLSAFFLVPVFGLSALTAIYGREYLAERARSKSLGFSWFAFNLLVASMALVVTARQVLLFLVAWEVMSLAAYVLVTLEHESPEVRRAGWVYLIATHVGTAFIVAMFLVMSRQAHSFDFDVIRGQTSGSAISAWLLLLALAGFGVKAGLVPFHVWLPEAHAAAPSHVSALMSGVLIKMGLYGLLRMMLLLGRPAGWFGPLLMVLGLAGALGGISLALYQRDMKRALAYSSVENMGLIALGLGTGVWGWTSGRPLVAVLGMSGALLHAWNHTLMKGLMFLGAGSVLHGCGTKDLERLGGTMKRMPFTGTSLVVGAVAISGLPPLNGFVSEWLIYLGLMDGALSSRGAIGAIGLLSVGIVTLVGALAAFCFIRLVGIACLGEARSDESRGAHESRWPMTAPLGLLAGASVAVALAPRAVMSATANVLKEFLGADLGGAKFDIPLANVGWLNAVLWMGILLGIALWCGMMRRRPVTDGETWGCGYAKPSARMQYTSRSFAELVSERMLPKRLRARISVTLPEAIFPGPGSLSSECIDPLTRDVYEPFLARMGDRFARLRWLQQGMLHVYLLYILVATLLALGWTSIATWSGR